VGLRDEEWAEEARPVGESPVANGASSTRGRRGVGSIHWGGDSRGVIVRGEAKRQQRRLGEEDMAWIERAREGFQIGAGLGPHVSRRLQRRSASFKQGVLWIFELCAKIGEHETCRGLSGL